MDKVMSFVKEKKYLGMIAHALIIIGTFLPLMTISVSFLGVSNSQSFSYIQAGGAGWLTLMLSLVALLMIFADKFEDKVPAFAKLSNQKFTLIPTVISAVILIINLQNYNASGASALVSSLGSASFSIGFWVIVVGLVAAVAYPFLYKGDSKAE